jgi:hypothetical protein
MRIFPNYRPCPTGGGSIWQQLKCMKNKRPWVVVRKNRVCNNAVIRRIRVNRHSTQSDPTGHCPPFVQVQLNGGKPAARGRTLPADSQFAAAVHASSFRHTQGRGVLAEAANKVSNWILIFIIIIFYIIIIIIILFYNYIFYILLFYILYIYILFFCFPQ